MSQPRWLTRAVRNQKRACLLALALVVGALWIAIPMGQWKVGVFVSAGIALGLVNLALTELSLLRSVESGDLISRKQYALSSLVRLTGVSLVAGVLAVVFWPEGGTVLLGLALFQMITLVLTGLPLLKEIRKA